MNNKILFICGSMNQTTMMHKISKYFPDEECCFTPYYSDGYVDYFAKNGFLDFSVLGGQFKQRTLHYLVNEKLAIDFKGQNHDYDLVFTCQDLIIPSNIKNKKIVLVQEGMTDPENLIYYAVKYLKLPRWLASTSVTGLSHAYNIFCVASEGYKDLFIRKGVDGSKIRVTGIPNFDNVKESMNNNFPHKNFVLVATSDTRETFKYENRKKFIDKALKIAHGRQLIFKLHPNENVARSTEEIELYAPGALVYSEGNIDHMIANCDVLITKYSSVVYLGMALGKEVYSEFNYDELKRMTPIQNHGTSAKNIAEAARELLDTKDNKILTYRRVI